MATLLDWMDDSLDCPTRFNRTKSKGHWNKHAKGISWFKPTAKEHINKMREIGVILSNYGHYSTEIKTRRPGYIVFEDDFQIVAEPFNDTTVR